MAGAFKCDKCGAQVNHIVFVDKTRVECDYDKVCSTCNGNLKGTIQAAPAIHGCDSFNPHYDSQLGEYVESKEHKAHLLKQYGLTQVAGMDSPRSGTKQTPVMSKDQARNYSQYIAKLRAK